MINQTTHNDSGIDKLYSIVISGLYDRYEHSELNAAIQRLDEEIEIAVRSGYVSTFIHAYNFRSWLQEKKIVIGPGYAHNPSSLILYALGITRINPLRHGLYFERFLNPNLNIIPPIIFITSPEYTTICNRSIELNNKVSGHKPNVQCIGCESIRLLNNSISMAAGIDFQKKPIPLKLVKQKSKNIELDFLKKWTDLMRLVDLDTMDEVINLWAVSKPGYENLIPSFRRRMQKEELINYPHPFLEDILKSTVGYCLFQEQISEILHFVYGISIEKAEVVRRILGKKRKNEIKSVKSKLETMSKKRGFSDNESNCLFKYVYKYSGFAYCKAQAVSEVQLLYEIVETVKI